jgi:tryptophanase
MPHELRILHLEDDPRDSELIDALRCAGIECEVNKVGAIVMLVAVNSATAAVSMHNMRNAKKLSMR